MLFILSILYIFHSTISAAPVSHVLRDAIPPDLSPGASPCICPSQQRSLWDILWSCLATIFACTWVSVHPNIPPSGEKWWKTGLRRLELMFWALIAPEMIILWAMKQWYGARGMVKKYYGHGWTKTHGYFIQMGGFTLFEGGKPTEVLLPQKMEELLLAGKIDLPQITEDEIRDCSKGDGLSKTLVIGQTTWFIAQCIARRVQGLILTELELVTGAFAVLNGVMYFLWWNKPLDVRCSVPVYLLDTGKEPFVFKSAEKSKFSFRDSILSLYFRLIETFAHSVMGIRKSTQKFMQQINLKAARKVITTIAISPWNTTYALCSRLGDILAPDDDLLEVAGSVSTVSTFYASKDYATATTADYLISAVASTIATLFGGIHCAAWFFTFPSHAESMIWRVCSAVISVSPLGFLFFFIASLLYHKAKSDSISEKYFDALTYIFAVPGILCLPIYAIARLLLLGEAFAALRYLPQDALAVVDWLSPLPHI